MKTMQFEVAGVKFRHADFLKANISRGDRLTLTPEPTNQFDALAIKIMKGDIQIGFVPRSHNKDRVLQETLRDRPDDVGCCVDAAWKGGCWVVVNIKEHESDSQNQANQAPEGTLS